MTDLAITADTTDIPAACFRLSRDHRFVGDSQDHSALVLDEAVVALIPHGSGFSARVRAALAAAGFPARDDQVASMGGSSTVRLYRAS